MAPLSHISARLHAIGCQMKEEVTGEPYKTMFIVCAHAGLKTGEDGPTHADPQPLQLVQENFPATTAVTLTPWDPQEMYPLVTAALAQRPALVFPFVTRPNETVPDRKALGLAPVEAAVKGLYKLRSAAGKADGTAVLQGSGVTYAFVEETLPLLEKAGIDLDVYYVASAELFDRLPKKEREEIFPEEVGSRTFGITGFTLPTLYRWVRSDYGREMSLHPFRDGHFLGSGQADMVLKEAKLHGEGQLEGIKRFLSGRS
jgi:transketolase